MYLIVVKSRGEPSFEIADKFNCPECNEGCPECNGSGSWWITTSGYRAHPYRYWDMDDIYDGSDYDAPKPMHMLDKMPEDAIDLFPTRQAPKDNPSSGKSLLAALGLLPKVQRRL